MGQAAGKVSSFSCCGQSEWPVFRFRAPCLWNSFSFVSHPRASLPRQGFAEVWLHDAPNTFSSQHCAALALGTARLQKASQGGSVLQQHLRLEASSPRVVSTKVPQK